MSTDLRQKAQAAYDLTASLMELTGTTNTLPDWLFGAGVKEWFDESVQKNNETGVTTAIKSEGVISQAKQLAALAGRGVGSVQTDAGALNLKDSTAVTQYLQTLAGKSGLKPEEFMAIVPALREALKGVVVVKPADGLERIKVAASRGTPQ